MRTTLIRSAVPLVLLMPGMLIATDAVIDEKAAQRMLKQSKCNNCHSVTREKEGPSFHSIAEKYRGNPDAEMRVFEHLTSFPKVCVDGKDETHEPLRFNELYEVENLARWILSR